MRHVYFPLSRPRIMNWSWILKVNIAANLQVPQRFFSIKPLPVPCGVFIHFLYKGLTTERKVPRCVQRKHKENFNLSRWIVFAVPVYSPPSANERHQAELAGIMHNNRVCDSSILTECNTHKELQFSLQCPFYSRLHQHMNWSHEASGYAQISPRAQTFSTHADMSLPPFVPPRAICQLASFRLLYMQLQRS